MTCGLQSSISDKLADLRHAIFRPTLASLRVLKKTIVWYIIKLYTRSFPPRLSGVEDMAN